MKDRMIVALDFDTLVQARRMIDALYPFVKIFKIGSQLFTACGPESVKMVHNKGAKVFLDLKFHDIPNTVAQSVAAAKKMGVFMANVHASGGKDMMMQAAMVRTGVKRPILLAVTVLTSMDKRSLASTGVRLSTETQVTRLARLAKTSGLDGVVCSAQEISRIRRICGKRFIIVTPGIRSGNAAHHDQKRVATASFAFNKGADYIVVGRPITKARDPLRAAKEILSHT